MSDELHLAPDAIGMLLRVAANASRLLDAGIENRMKAEHVRELAVSLNDLWGHLPGFLDDPDGWDDLAMEFSDTEFSSVTMNEHGLLVFVPEPDEEEELTEGAEP